MRSLTVVLFLVSLFTASGCSPSFSTSSNSSTSNVFTTAGNNLTFENITSANSPATYYGQLLYMNGSNLYGAKFHFTLNQVDNTSGYITDFYVDRVSQMAPSQSTTITSATSLSVSSSYSATDNSLTITSGNSRYIKLNLTFGNAAHIGSKIANAGGIFSYDFTTLVGGDHSTYVFIAQKASTHTFISTPDLKNAWSLAKFSINASGDITMGETTSLTVAGTSGSGYAAFSGTNNGVTFEGETRLIDSDLGLFVFDYDTTVGNGPAVGDGTSDGIFSLSPNKNSILVYDFSKKVFFAGNR